MLVLEMVEKSTASSRVFQNIDYRDQDDWIQAPS